MVTVAILFIENKLLYLCFYFRIFLFLDIFQMRLSYFLEPAIHK